MFVLLYFSRKRVYIFPLFFKDSSEEWLKPHSHTVKAEVGWVSAVDGIIVAHSVKEGGTVNEIHVSVAGCYRVIVGFLMTAKRSSLLFFVTTCGREIIIIGRLGFFSLTVRNIRACVSARYSTLGAL